MRFTRTKLFIAAIFVLSLCPYAWGAAAGTAAPSTYGGTTGTVGIPGITTGTAGQPAQGTQTINVPNQGIDFSNVDAVQQDLNTTPQNVDLTNENTTTTQPAQQEQNIIQQQNNAVDFDSQVSDAEINRYFDEMLNPGDPTRNPMRRLMNALPRFGMSFFRRPPSTYAPMENVPVTQDYRIGTGDQLTLTLWGIPEEGNFSVVVNRDGIATIPRIGAVRLAGYTLAEAERVIAARLNQYYTGYQMNLSTGRLGSIMVYVTGNARRPGAYTVSSFSTLVNALLASGGPSANGSLRRIELKRNGRTITVFDMYAMLLQGDKTQDVRLTNGDVIYIPPVGPLVGLAGEVRTPGVYELNGATRVQDLLYIAGGLSAQTYRGRIQLYRVYNHEYAGATEGSLEDLQNQELSDGDVIRLYPVYSYAASAAVTGQVMRGGTFVIIPGQTRVADLIKRAGGLTTTASDQAEITRVTPSLEGPVQERFKINIYQALQGDPMNNMTLENGDTLTVLVIPSWRPQIQATITGAVQRPGVYSMFEGEKLSDLIERAGGFSPKAFLRGAIFTRVRVAAEQRESIALMADRMEQELLEATQNQASSGASTNAGAMNQEYRMRRDLIRNLRNIDVMGRVVTKIDTAANIKGTVYDYELEDGDVLRVPEVPLTVNVMGAVYSSSSQLYRPDMSINSYVNAAGGAIRSAHKRMIYLIKSDGSTIRLTRSTAMLSSKQWTAPRGFSAKVEPGDTIVVPVKYMNRESTETLKDTIDIIYKLAVSVGVILNNTK